MKETFSKLAGEEKKADPHPLHVALAEKPEELFKAHAELIEERVQKKLAQKEEQLREDQATVRKVIDDYPDLAKPNTLKYAILEADRLMREDSKLSRKEALEKGMVQTATDLGLKKIDEETKKKAAQNAFIPPVGGANPAIYATQDNTDLRKKSAQDFISGRRQGFKDITQRARSTQK